MTKADSMHHRYFTLNTSHYPPTKLNSYNYTYIRTYNIHTYIMYIHTYIHMYIIIHTYIHTYVHTYIHK